MADTNLKKEIADAEFAIKQAEDAITKAKAAGIDVGELETALNTAKANLEKLKAVYGK